MEKDHLSEKVFAAADPREAFDALSAFLGHCSHEITQLHLDIAEKILSKEKVSDPEAIQILAAKFSEKCQEMDYFLSQDNDEEFFRKGLFVWDWAFIETLIRLGSTGKSFAKKIILKLEANSTAYYHSKDAANLLCNWFVEPDEENQIQYFHSPIFFILTEAIWHDSAKNLWMRKKKMSRQSPKECGSPPSSRFCPKRHI